MSRTLLIDGDVFAYRVATAAEESTDWGDGIWTLHADADQAKDQLKSTLDGLMKTCEGDFMVIALTDKQNFRKDILPTYKANRASTRKPMVLPVLKDYIRENYKSFERPGLEADDVLGILSTSPHIIPGEKCIVSVDKDFNGIPGYFFNTNKPDLGARWISQGEADYWHLTQTLTGDNTDGYSGCPGVGAVGARKILDPFFDADPKKHQLGVVKIAWEAVVVAFQKAKLGEEEALKQARVARILRYTDYDFINKKPILWSPK